MYKEYKEGQKHASKNADISDSHEAFKDAGYILTDKDLIVDIDNLPRDTINAMIHIFGIKTQTVWTDRGVHLYFEKPKGFKNSNGVTVLGFPAEFKHKKNTNAITIKRHGVMREIQNNGVREPLPECLIPLKKAESLLGLSDGDGRNSKLHAFKFKLMGMGISDYQYYIKFINENIFADPLEDSELNTVGRKEELKADENKEPVVARQLSKELKVVKFGDILYSYNGEKYVSKEFENEIYDRLPDSRTYYVEEVIKQMKKRIRNVQEPKDGFEVKFKNGILKEGRFWENDSTDFTPYYIDLEYDEEAEPIEIVENYLNNLTGNDEEYKQFILEIIAHTLITNADFKRDIAKFFIFIGDGGNGKGTLLTVIRTILGTENCSSLSPEEMTKESYFTSLQNKLVNLGDDIEDKAINEKQMKVKKNVSTCDFVAMRRLFEQSKETIITTSLIFTSNHILKSFEKGDSYKRRVAWCPMFNKPKAKDRKFLSKLTSPETLKYWVKLIVEEYVRIYENGGINIPKVVEEYNEAYHDENNTCLEWAKLFEPEHFTGKTPADIYAEYEVWAEEGKLNLQSQKVLGQTLKEVHGLVSKTVGKQRKYVKEV